MRPVLLNLDQALVGQVRLQTRFAELDGCEVSALDLGPQLRLWARPPVLALLRDRLAQYEHEGPEVVFMGSGDFHHLSALLIERAIGADPRRLVTVIHFDNHPDWVRFESGLHCGSWVGHTARLPFVSRVITIGVCSKDILNPEHKHADLSLIEEDRVVLLAYRNPAGGNTTSLKGHKWPTIGDLSDTDIVGLLADTIETEAIYVTIDKDVLRCADAVTNWDQGNMSLTSLCGIVQWLCCEYRVIGADVVGDWSLKKYSGGICTLLRKRGEALLDQPWSAPPLAAATDTNDTANLALLNLFSSHQLAS